MKKLKWSRKKIVGLIAAVLVAVVIVVSAVNAGGTEGRYQETTVAARDIVSYLEFQETLKRWMYPTFMPALRRRSGK